jgi:ArsR family transcriptional regulator, arsenate/arsenite/antimonite-responsive transcriptional repressor
MKSLMRVLKACADPNRMRVLKMLQARELCVCEITEALHIAQPSVSRHMRILEDAELVEQSKVGPWVNYRLNPDPANPYAREILDRLSGWLQEDREILSLTRKTAVLDRNVICGKKSSGPSIPALKEARP